MMENYDRTMELIDTAYDSAGKSSEQFAKYQDTIEYKLKQLSNTWEQLRTGFFNSDTYKDFIDFANKALDLVNQMDLKQILTVGAIGATLGTTIVTDFIDGIRDSTVQLKTAWKKTLQQVFDTNGKSLLSSDGFTEALKDLTDKTILNKQKYISNMNGILGSKSADAPQLEISVESEKTLELQKQLSIYAELEEKRKSLVEQAKLELSTGNGISQQTIEQSNAVVQETQEKSTYINNLLKELGYEKEITAENAKQLLQDMEQGTIKSSKSKLTVAAQEAGTNALSAGITSALMMAISGADLSTVIKTAGISAVTATIPSLISAVMPTIVSILTGPIGLTVALVAVITSVVIAVDKKAKEARKAELERLSKIESANKELQEENDNLVSSYKKVTKEGEKLQKAIKNVQTLQNKKFLTQEEQNTLDDAASYLQENYEGVIEEDELTGHFTVIETKLSEIQENTKKEQQENVADVYKNIVAQQKNLEDRKIEREYLISSMEEAGFTGLEGQVGYDIGNEFAENSEYGKLVYANVSTVFGQIKDELSDLKTIYGDELNLNEIFGISNFEDLLSSDLDTYELSDELEEAGLTAKGIEEKIKEISTKLSSIDENQENEAKKAAVEDSLLLQGWDETTAKIASYASEDFEIGTNIQIETEIKQAVGKAGGYKGFLGSIKEGNLSDAFGEDNYKQYEKAFEMLGYGGEGGKQLSELFAAGTNFVEWDELSEEMREAILNLTDEDSETWDHDGFFGVANRKESKITTDVLTKVLAAQLIEASEVWSEEDQQLLEENKANFANLSQHMMDSSDKTWTEYQNDVNNIINNQSDERVKTAMEKYRDEAEDSVYKQWSNYIDQLKNIGGTGNGIKSEIIDKLDFSSIQYFTEQLSTLDLSQYGYEKIADYINTNFENLNENALNVLANVPIEELSSLTLSSSQEYIDKLTEATGDASLAQQVFYDYIEQMKLITKSGAFLGENSVQILKAQYQEELSGFNEKYSSIFEANEEMLENKALSSETYFKLMKEGFEDYVEITSNGYELISDKAEEAWTKAALSPLTDLREKMSEQDALIKEAEDYRLNSPNLNNLIATYSKLKNEGKGTAEVEAALGDKIDLVNKIIDEGYTSMEEYIQALEEGKAALSEMEPEVWIQGLELLSEALEQAEEEVEDLEEELKDLNEQLEENKEALNEAEDALRQAIHGSDDFQSSLDGLINYTEKIERLDKAIKKTKEALEDVSEVDEARGLLGQLNDQYKNKTITIGAENLAIDAALSNLQSTLLQNYGDYISFDAEGNPLIDFAYMQIDANDEIRKAFEEEYNLYNEYRDKKEENLDKLEEIEKEKEQQREETLKNFVTIQEDVISVLKEKAKEEIDVTKEKYEALEEADNDYLDALQEAIDKQRELRDQQNKYEDLATKEKKLSLLQRDTSGANQKKVLSLQNEIEDDRQNLLDSEVDNLIESMKELYEKQKEARDAEIEYMEEVTDNAQYFADWASNIMSTWQSVEDMQAWYLENDSDAQDMTVEQTEVYLDQIKQDYSDYVQYIALSATDFATNQEELNAAINEMYENTSTNVENIGSTTQEIAQTAAEEAIEKATKTRDDARDKLEETQEKIKETTDELAKAESNAVVIHGAAMDAMVEASQSAMEEVSVYATKILADILGVDLSDKKQALKFARDYNFINDEGYISKIFATAVSEAGGDISQYQVYQPAQDSYKVYVSPDGAPSQTIKIFNNKEDAEAFVAQEDYKYKNFGGLKVAKNISAFAQGGLVDYTGPAWVDGTKSKPEAFLNAEDTKRIGEAAKILADIPIFNSTSNAQNTVSANVGDTSIEIHINVENISSDYDVDEMIDRVKQDIVDVSKPIGSSVILKK